MIEKTDLLKVIDTEISYQQTLRSQEGVSMWALLTTFIAVLLFIFNQFEKIGTNLNMILVLNFLLIGMLCLEVLKVLYVTISPSVINYKRNRFDSYIDVLSTRGKTLVLVLRFLFIIVLFRYVPLIEYSMLSKTIFLLYIIFLTFSFGLLFPIVRDKIPIPKMSNTKGYFVPVLIVALWGLYIFSVVHEIYEDNLYSVKVYGLNLELGISFVILIYVMSRIISTTFDRDTIFSLLNQIRRDLALGNITDQEAVNQFDLILFGLKIDHFLRDELFAWGDAHKALLNKINLIQTKVDEINSNKSTTVDQIELNKDLLEIKEAVSNYSAASKNWVLKGEVFSNKLLQLIKKNPDSAEDCKEMVKLTKKWSEENIKKIDYLESEMINIKKKITKK